MPLRLQYMTGLLLVAAGLLSGYAQQTKTSYYIDINKAARTVIHTIHDEQLSLQYQDAYGQRNDIPLKVYNWKREQVASYSLSKTYGANYFNIHLGAFFNTWNIGDIYTFEVQDESRHTYELQIRKIAPPEKEKPVVNIFVNPIHLSCKEITGNTVEFYGSITGGKAPYKVNWYVLNESRTDFLYQPREEVIERPGNTMVIRVDRNPAYYVLLHVRDACGNEQKQMVTLVCNNNRRKVNTLFVEPIEQLPPQVTQKNN